MISTGGKDYSCLLIKIAYLLIEEKMLALLMGYFSEEIKKFPSLTSYRCFSFINQR